MTDDPSMSPAKVGRVLADAYMDHYMTQNVNLLGFLTNNVTFAVLDAKACSELYDAYVIPKLQCLADNTRRRAKFHQLYCPITFEVPQYKVSECLEITMRNDMARPSRSVTRYEIIVFMNHSIVLGGQNLLLALELVNTTVSSCLVRN